MRFPFFCSLVLFLFSDCFAQSNQVGVSLNWAGRHAEYPVFFPIGGFPSSKSVLKNKFIYSSSDEDSTSSRWQFFEVGGMFKRQINEGNYFWRLGLAYFYVKRENKITQVFSNIPYFSTSQSKYKAFEIIPGIGRQFQKDGKVKYQLGLLSPFYIAPISKEMSLDQPLQLQSTTIDTYLDVYSSNPSGYQWGLEAFFNIGTDVMKRFNVIFEMASGFYYYWINGNASYRLELSNTATGTAPYKITTSTSPIKESGFKWDLLNNFSLHVLYNF